MLLTLAIGTDLTTTIKKKDYGEEFFERDF